MLATLKYAWLTIRHKWFVLLAGLRIGCPLWRLIKHDMSKLGWYELPKYGRQFFGGRDDPYGFMCCWIHHQNHNDHHWEYWIPRTGHSRCTPPYEDNKPVTMPRGAVLEMVADWFGASRAYEGAFPTSAEDWPWLQLNLHNVYARVDGETHAHINDALRIGGIEPPIIAQAENCESCTDPDLREIMKDIDEWGKNVSG